MKALTKVVLVLLALGQPACTNGGQTESSGPAQRQSGLPASGPAPARQASTNSPALQGHISTPWSEPIRGLIVQLEAFPSTPRPGGNMYHPGESFRLFAGARNPSGKEVIVTGLWLHVLTPDGTHCLWLGYPLARGTKVGAIRQGATRQLASWGLRLTRAEGEGRHSPEDTKAELAPLDLTRPGTYTFWFSEQTQASPQSNAPSPAIVSPKLNVEVRTLTDSDTVHQVTPTQCNDLRAVAEGPDRHAPQVKQSLYRLQKQLELARNVGLADAATALLVEQAGKPGPPGYPMKRLWQILESRAADGGRPPRLAIKGDYLRPLARFELQRLKAWYDVKPPSGAPFRDDWPLVSALRALCLESKEEPLRKPLSELAKTHAKLTKPPPWNKDDGSTVLIGYHHARLGMAWALLQELDVLIGMTEAEVTTILGQSTSRPKDLLDWCAGSRMHVNPHIWVVIADGKVRSVGGR